MKCSITGCDKQAHSLGYCPKHRFRLRRHGDPLATARNMADAIEDRLWSRVEKAEGCWNWTGGTTRAGYGCFSFKGEKHYAHRVAFELSVGPIPDGLEVDHLCANRRCCNPSHLEAVTPDENKRRAKVRNFDPYCHKGHLKQGDNLLMEGGTRRCRECRDACGATRSQRRRRKQAVSK